MEQELDEELQFHLEHKIEEGIAEGLSPDEARYAGAARDGRTGHNGKRRCGTCAAFIG